MAGASANDRFSAWVASLVAAARDHARTVVAVGALITAIAAVYAATHFRINTDNENMLSADLAFRQQAVAFKQMFPALTGNVLVIVDGRADAADDIADRLKVRFRDAPSVFGPVFDPTGDDVFRENGLLFLETAELDRLAARLAAAQPLIATLNRDPSLGAFVEILGKLADAIVDGDTGIDPTPVLDAAARTVEAVNAGRTATLDWRSLLTGEGAEVVVRRILVLQPPLEYDSLNPVSAAMSAIQSAIADIETGEGGVSVRVTGGPVMEAEELESVGEGLGLAGALSGAVVVFVLAIGLASWRRALAVVLTLIAGLVLTMTFALLAVGPFNLISVAFAVLFVGLGVDFGIHVALRLDAGSDAGIRALARPLSLCALSTAVAFLSFTWTDYDGLAELGAIAAAGMAIAWLLSLTLLPALCRWLGEQTASSPALAAETPLWRVRLPVKSWAWLTAAAALILSVIAAVTANRAVFDFDPMNLRDHNRQAMAAFLDLTADGEASAHEINVVAPAADSAADIAERLEALAPVRSAVTIDDFVPADQGDKIWLVDDLAFMLAPSLADDGGSNPRDDRTTMAAVEPAMARLTRLADAAGERGAAGARRLVDALASWRANGAPRVELETALLSGFPAALGRLRTALRATGFGVEDLPAGLLDRYRTADGRVRTAVRPHPIVGDRDRLREFVNAVRRIAPDAGGAAVIVLEAGEAVVGAFVKATVIAVVAVAVILFASLKSVASAVLCFVPLLFAWLMTAAATVWISQPFNFANVIVLPLLFGIGVDYAIHALAALRGGGAEAIRTGRAIALSAMTTLGSFGAIALSGHPGTASMGLLLAVAIGFTLIGTLIVLPAVVVVIGPHRLWGGNA